MESKAIAKFQRVSPRKTRLVAKNVQGMGVEEAMNLLRFTPNKPAGVLFGVLKSALANASQLGGVDVDAMVVKEIVVNEGPTWKRFTARAARLPIRCWRLSMQATVPSHTKGRRGRTAGRESPTPSRRKPAMAAMARHRGSPRPATSSAAYRLRRRSG